MKYKARGLAHGECSRSGSNCCYCDSLRLTLNWVHILTRKSTSLDPVLKGLVLCKAITRFHAVWFSAFTLPFPLSSYGSVTGEFHGLPGARQWLFPYTKMRE